MQSVDAGYELIDAGDDRRLERFGEVVVDRPAPTAIAPRREPPAWEAADARFETGRGGRSGHWTIASPLPDPWTVPFGGLTFELRPADSGQLGLFPEHAAQWGWLHARVAERLGPDPAEVLDLFAYTGGSTLAAAAAGGHVVHVDASRPAVAWARRNAERNGLAEAPVRWLVDDAVSFAAREVRRGRRYAGLILDPPSYGHGPRGEPWRLGEDLDALLATCASLLAPDGFVLLTAHTPGEGPERLAHRLAAIHHGGTPTMEAGDLSITARSGTRLHLGAWARFGGPR